MPLERTAVFFKQLRNLSSHKRHNLLEVGTLSERVVALQSFVHKRHSVDFFLQVP